MPTGSADALGATAAEPLSYRAHPGTAPKHGATARVHVPATSANLGPGFDVVGLALAYGDDLSVAAVPRRGERAAAAVRVTGEGAGCLPDDGTHLAARTIRSAWDAWGVAHGDVDLELDAVNRIPHGRGQGSSAAVIVAALTAAAALLPEPRPQPEDVFELAARIEGHPDNVAPAVHGGLTLSWQESDPTDGRRFRTAVLAPHPDLVPIVAIPDVQLSTAVARSLLPSHVPHADAVSNSARAALLIHAATQAPELLFTATEDRLHQAYRAPAMPATADLVSGLRARGLAATVSGAGPTVLVLARAGAGGDADAAVSAVRELTAASPESWRVLQPGVDRVGATVKMHRPEK